MLKPHDKTSLLHLKVGGKLKESLEEYVYDHKGIEKIEISNEGVHIKTLRGEYYLPLTSTITWGQLTSTIKKELNI